MTHSYRVHFFHLIWSTKCRSPLLTKDIQQRLYPYMAAIIKDRKGLLLEIGGMEDHVHLLIELSRLDSFPSLIRDLKSHTTAWLNKEFFPRGPRFAWQEGYGSFSVSFSQIHAVRTYIQNQEAHHAQYSFDEEYQALLQRHQVKFDARFVLG